MAHFLKTVAVLLLALALSIASAYVMQDLLGTWIQAGEEWAVMAPFLGAWAIVVATTLAIVGGLTRRVVALDRAAAVLSGLVLASAFVLFAMQIYVEPSLADRALLAFLAAIMAPMLLTIIIQWGILRWYRSFSARSVGRTRHATGGNPAQFPDDAV